MNLFQINPELYLACFDAPREIVAEEILHYCNLNVTLPAWITGFERILAVERDASQMPICKEEIELDFAFVNNGLRVIPFIPRRFLLWTPVSNPTQTALMTSTGGDTYNIVSVFSERLNCDAVGVGISDNPTDKFPGFIFCLYGKENRRRYIHAIKDIWNWKFDSSGDILSFERREYYDRKRIRDRLNRDIIVEYMRALGYDIVRDEFWKSNCSASFIWKKPYTPDATENVIVSWH